MHVLLRIILPNLLAPLLFWSVLHFRKKFVPLCGSPRAACYVFAVLQTIITAARFYSVLALLDVPDWGTFSFPFEWVAKGLIGAGMFLNIMVYVRLGICGVYYGSAFGVDIPWCEKWPYGPYGIPHPQYWGVMLQTTGATLQHGTIVAVVFVFATAVQYWVIVRVEQHYFGLIDAKRMKKVAKK